MPGDAVELLLDALWKVVVAGREGEGSTVTVGADAAVLMAARADALEQQRLNEVAAEKNGASRRERRRASDDAQTYAAIARVCDSALEATEPSRAVATAAMPASDLQNPPVVMAPPLVAVTVVIGSGRHRWSKLVQFSEVPRVGDRLEIAPVSLLVDSVVWFQDANGVGVPAAMCQPGEHQDTSRLRDHGWARQS